MDTSLSFSQLHNYSQLLHNRIDLKTVPFSERSSRIMLFAENSKFSIKLAERWTAWEHEFGHYRRRPPIVREFELLDGDGQPLSFELDTYPHVVELKTAPGVFRWTFLDEETLYLQLPPAPCGLRFSLSAAHGRTDRRGGEFKGDPAHRDTHRNVAYTTNAHITENTITSIANDIQSVLLRVVPGTESSITLNITPRLGFNRALPSFAETLERANRRWYDWFEAVPKVSPQYEAQYYWAWWCLRAGLIGPRFYNTRESMAPSKTYYVGVWQWDSFFHALAYRNLDKKLAQDHIRIVLDHQRADGMIPDAIHDEGAVFEFALPQTGILQEVTKPPLIAWAALKVFDHFPDVDFLQEIYEPITRWNEWWFNKNDDDHDGIVQYNHPYMSSDDNPLWDEGMPVESPDINTYLVMQMDSLARIAEIIGETNDAVMWRRRADELTQKMIDHFWDEDAGLFWAMKDHKPIRTVTLFNLYPLLTGRLPKAMEQRVIRHLTSPDEFWTPYPLPVVSASDPKFDADQMWRGPTWVNINYLFIEGLLKCGYPEKARELLERTLDVVNLHADIYEYYNPLTGNHPPKAAGIFGWTSAVYVDLAIKASRGEII